ncbi:MAG: hypothetical protein JW940_08400 [Polyangiaceae bacterium]|nr:hypothetical protein [Polyangiaceae bacterium]
MWLSAVVLVGCQGRLVHGPPGAVGSSGQAGTGQENAQQGAQGGLPDGSSGADGSGGRREAAAAGVAGEPSGNATGGTRTGAAGQAGRGHTGGEVAEGGRTSADGGTFGDGGTDELAGGTSDGGTDELTGGTAGTGGELLAGGTEDTGGRPPTGGTATTGGSLATGGSSHTGGIATGGTGGTTTGGTATGGTTTGGTATGGGGGTGGGDACTGTETRGECPANREVCSNGAWVPDLSCYSEACDLLTCPDDSSDCCLGWGRSGVDGFDYTPDDDIVTSFSLEQGSETYFYATFEFGFPSDIGAITLYFSQPIAWGTITAVEVDVLFDGDPFPTLEISLEDGVTNRGCIWTPLFVSGRTLVTPANMYQPPLGCFSGNGCPDADHPIDRMNVRLRPYDMDPYTTSEAWLELYAVRVYTD